MDGYEIIDARFRSFVLPDARLETLGDGFRWLEGPVWFADRDCLLVSDLPNDRIPRWTESGGVSVFRRPSDFANGHTRDREGRLLDCSHRGRQIQRTELDGSVTVLVSSYQGKRPEALNDIVCKSDGTIWFSDPDYGIDTHHEGGKQTPELPPIRCRPRPDHPRLRCRGRGCASRTPREFHRVAPGYADGFRCGEDGKLWSSAGDGVHCIDPGGNLLGKVKVPATVSNLVFGGRNRSRLFVCAGQMLYAIYISKRGAERP